MGDLRAEKIREMTGDEIQQRILDLKEELFNLRFRNSTRQLDNPLRIREVRRDVARLMTVLRRLNATTCSWRSAYAEDSARSCINSGSTLSSTFM